MFSYRAILKQAWQITIRFKYLWLFGLFAVLTAAGGSWEYNLINQGLGQNLVDASYFQLERIISVFEVVSSFGSGMIAMLSGDIWGLLNALTLLIISGIFLVVLVWIGVVSQGALINAVKKILTKKKSSVDISYRENIAVGNKNFWPVFGMNILIQIFVIAAFIITSLPLLLMSLKDMSGLSIAYVVLFVIFVPVATGLALLMKYAISYQIFDNLGFFKSIEKGYKLFKKNWLISVEMAVILFIVSFLASFLFATAISIALFPVLFMSVIIESTWIIWVAGFIGLALTMFFGALLSTFQITTWTNLFFILKENSGKLAKLERLFKKISK